MKKVFTILMLLIAFFGAEAQVAKHNGGAKFPNATQETSVDKIPLLKFNSNKLNYWISPEDFKTALGLNFDLTGYATESWVNSQGFITSDSDNQTLTFNDGDLSISNGNTIDLDSRYSLLGSSSGGLSIINEGNGNGYRLSNETSNHHTIGNKAIDLSTSTGETVGAEGAYSFSVGVNSEARAESSVAIGQNANVLSGGYRSIAIGSGGTFSNLAYSVAIGYGAYTKGYYSFSFGANTVANGILETALGSANTEYTPINPNGWNPLDRLLTIGNGQNFSVPSDALIILKNGGITAPSLDISEINTGGNKSLITKEYIDNSYVDLTTNQTIVGNKTFDGVTVFNNNFEVTGAISTFTSNNVNFENNVKIEDELKATGDVKIVKSINPSIEFTDNSEVLTETISYSGSAEAFLFSTDLDLGANKISTDDIITNTYKVNGLNTAPSSSSDTGITGEIRYTSDYIYVCVAPNTWKRSSLETW